MYLEICYSFVLPIGVIFSKGGFNKELLYFLGKCWHFIEAQAKRDGLTQENTLCHLLGTQTQNNLSESSLDDSGRKSPVLWVPVTNPSHW